MHKHIVPISILLSIIAVCSETVAADKIALQKTISSNEAYVRRFKVEQTNLLKQPPDAETHQKLDNLNKKIRSLESEIARLKPFVQTEPAQSAAPVPAPGLAQMPKMEPQWVDTVPQEEPEADEDVYYVGSDWMHMSMREKEKYIEIANSQLAKIGVLVTKHVFFYTMEVDKALREDPSLRAEKLDNVYMSQVYRNEPPNRDRLEMFRGEIVKSHA